MAAERVDRLKVELDGNPEALGRQLYMLVGPAGELTYGLQSSIWIGDCIHAMIVVFVRESH